LLLCWCVKGTNRIGGINRFIPLNIIGKKWKSTISIEHEREFLVQRIHMNTFNKPSSRLVDGKMWNNIMKILTKTCDKSLPKSHRTMWATGERTRSCRKMRYHYQLHEIYIEKTYTMFFCLLWQFFKNLYKIKTNFSLFPTVA